MRSTQPSRRRAGRSARLTHSGGLLDRTSTLLALLALICLAAPDAVADDVKNEIRRYKRTVRRPALYLRVKAMERLAATRDPLALETLIKRYKRPEDPQDHVAYLVAGVCAERFTGEAHEAAWAKWLDMEKKREDAWLWYVGQQVRVRNAGAAPLVAAIDDARLDPFLRAASLTALARTDMTSEALKAIQATLAEGGPQLKKRKDTLGRVVLVEACAAALGKCRPRAGSPEFTEAATLVIDQLERDDLFARTPWVIARQLAIALDVDRLYLEAAPWRKALLARQAKPEELPQGRTRARPVKLPLGRTIPRFLGIEGTGSRIAFVIDCSDSMLKPLTPTEVERIKRRPVTGTDPVTGKPNTANGAPDDDGGDDLGKRLPWDRIKTRFDAAREALRLSLQSLGEEMRYVVIPFGHDAKLLGDQGLVPATEDNLRRTLRALDAIRALRGDAQRPDGRLMGYTNLHGALLDAFQVTESGLLEGGEHIAEEGFAEGVETIFVLSDGAPNWDDFDAVDRNDDDLRSGDPEARTLGEKAPTLNFYGPYAFVNHLLRDALRLNLFRQVEIHCVGIGEANAQLLRRLATIGQGEFHSIEAR